jgi:hypothetical protein
VDITEGTFTDDTLKGQCLVTGLTGQGRPPPVTAVVAFLSNVVRLPLVMVVTRLRLDAALYDPAPPRQAGKKGRPAVKGKRQSALPTIVASHR